MQTIRLIGRASRLSLLQLEIVKQRIEACCPGIKVQMISRSSRGDQLVNVPLQTVEGTDFFTREIFEALQSREADIAVHSLKDMSSEHFFGENRFAVVDRDDVRDVAIFHAGIKQKIAAGEKVVIGTCSPRREEMAIGFLQKALPQLSTTFRVVTKEIRGNVDTRLRKLQEGEYDGIILATAGLNRLLRSLADANVIEALLRDKPKMVLPLIECVPAPCQGAIVAEAQPANSLALSVLETINVPALTDACIQEKRLAAGFGTGCLQRFGVTTIHYGQEKTLYAAGRDNDGKQFSTWTQLPEIKPGKSFFSTTDHMGSFFQYEYYGSTPQIDEPVVYIANYKAVEAPALIGQLQSKKIWVSGTKTWTHLAAKGIWVEGSADAFGLEYLSQPWQMPLLNISNQDIAVVTNEQSANTWRKKGWRVYSTYSTSTRDSKEMENSLRQADGIFWTSFRQYEQYRSVLKPNVVHSCPFGETAEQMKAAGLEPVIFPNIKAFQQWRRTFAL